MIVQFDDLNGKAFHPAQPFHAENFQIICLDDTYLRHQWLCKTLAVLAIYFITLLLHNCLYD